MPVEPNAGTPADRRRRGIAAFARLLAGYLASDEATRRSVDSIVLALDAPAPRPRPADREALIDALDDLLTWPSHRGPGA